MEYDFRGIQGVLHYINEWVESGTIESRGSDEAALNLRNNLASDLGKLYISLQNNDTLMGKCDGIMSECRRFSNLFNRIDASKCSGMWYFGLTHLYTAANALLALYKEPQQGQRQAAPEPQPEPKQQYFDKAVEKGVMRKTESGYKWLFGGNCGKVRLAYFLTKIHGKYGKIPFKHYEELFGMKRLDRAVSQLADVKKPQKWRAYIDELLE